MDNTKGIQDISLEMLKEFIQICNKHNLRYFLLGGTCLGAVRHKGFIPWDDDIDVGMPRNDYNKFCEIAQKELKDGLFFQNSKTDKNYPMNFAKIRNSNTTFIETSISKIKVNHGVYLDIFPLDGYSNAKKDKFLNRIYNLRVGCIYKANTFKAFIKKLAKIILSFPFAVSYKKARDKRDALIQKYNFDESDLVTNYCGAWGDKEIVPRDYFSNGIEGEFEGLKVTLPEKYDLYLKHVYGDYMQLPPEEKRVTHHYTTVIDLEKPYTYYTKK